MSAMKAAAATCIPPSSFGRRNLASSSFSSLYLRPVILPPRFAALVARSTRFSASPTKRHGCILAAASAAGSSQFRSGEDENPYQILGIGTLDGFDKVNMAYKRRRKDAEISGDTAYLLKLERAYDVVMMEQLQNRKKGVANGSIQEYGEVEGRGIYMAQRVLRSLGLVLGSIFAASLGYTGLTNFAQFLGHYIPSVVYTFQELIVTTASSVVLCILAS